MAWRLLQFILPSILLVACGPAGAMHEATLPPKRPATLTPFQPSGPTEAVGGGTTGPGVDPAIRLAATLAAGRFQFQRSELMPAATDILIRVNQARASEGAPPLQAHSRLTDLAFLRCEDLVARAYLDHVDPVSGENLAWALLTSAGFEGMLAENLFAATGPLASVPEAVVTAWVGSGDHRQSMLDRQFRLTGVGLMGDGTWWKVCQVFAEGGP